jgi:heptosyltransferase-2
MENCNVREFAGFIEKCNLIISGDTLAMHIGIALRKKIIAIFTSTCPQEIDLYERGEKIITKFECAPCYKKECFKKPNCIDAIDVEEIYRGVLKNLT